MNEEIDHEVQMAIARTLIKLQKFEFLVHGIVAHFKTDILTTFKRFRGLNGRTFLSNDTRDKLKRKQTLGQIFHVLKDGANFIYTDDLDDFLERRNSFIHSFWRDFISSGKYGKERCIAFLSKLENDTDEWDKVFRGMLFVIGKNIFEKQSKEEQEQMIKNGKFHKLFDNSKFEPNFIEMFIKNYNAQH